jgi:signal transduction histidine kinase
VNQQSADPVNKLLSIRGEGLVVFNSDGCVVSTSPVFLALTGAKGDADNLLGLNEAQFSYWLAQRSPSGARFSGVARLRLRALQDESRRQEIIEIKTGSALPTLLELTWWGDAAEASAGLLFVRDASVDSRTDQAKQKFLAIAAHDLRTPLASIAGFAEVLQTQTLDAQTQQDFLNIMVGQAELLTQMMTEVFDLARMDAQKGKDYRFLRTNLQLVVADVVEGLALPEGRTLPHMQMPQTPVWVMADTKKLAQALRQVLLNAYQFSPDGGGVRIEVSLLGYPDASDMVCLQVADTGIGMTPEQTSHIADRYFHASTATTTAGRGLGMALVKKVVERHHGDLRVLSVPLKGTQVEIDLPIALQVS